MLFLLLKKHALDLDQENIKKTEENLRIWIFFDGRLLKSA